MIIDASRRLLTGTIIAAACLSLVGCATTPDVGVRDDYRDVRVDKITVAPVYSTSKMGMEQSRLDDVRGMVAKGAVEALQTFGYDVATPEQLDRRLRQAGLEQAYRDGILLRAPLTNYFEPGDTENPSREITTIQKLHQADALPSRYILLGELVYHTQTRCRVDPREYHPLAAIEGPVDAVSSNGRPCVVTHVRFKLVDAKTAKTMWYNEVLLETRDADSVDTLVEPNIYRAVDRAVTGKHGLQQIGMDG